MINWRKKLHNWLKTADLANEFIKLGTRGSAKSRRDKVSLQKMLQATRALAGDLNELEHVFSVMEESASMLLLLVSAMREWEAVVPDYIILPDEFEAAEKFLERLGMLEKLE